MYDILQVFNLKYPGEPAPLFLDDPEWVEFDGLRPEGQTNYQDWLAFAQQADTDGELADWDTFIEMLSENLLLGFLIQVKGDNVGLSIALLDLLTLISFPALRKPQTVLAFFQRVLIEFRKLEIEVPVSVAMDWNQKVSEHDLPDSFLILG